MSGEPSPKVAVVIPVKDRRSLLRNALDALDRQTFRDFEVIVIDDRSSDGSGEEAIATPVAGRPVRLLHNEGSGSVAARMMGVRSTASDVLAFTDSDCVPSPDWLQRGLDHLAQGIVLVHGRTLPQRQPMPLERSLTETGAGLFPTCNLMVTRAAYDAVGGFDPSAGDRLRFRGWPRAAGIGFGEDTLFGWAVALRFPTVYEERMLVHHHVFPADLEEWLSRSWQMGAFPSLVREVPELRRTLMRRRILFGKRSRVPVYATAASLCTRSPALISAAVGWWALHRLRYSIRGTRIAPTAQLKALPVQMLLDVVQSTALVAGSVRARTLVI